MFRVCKWTTSVFCGVTKESHTGQPSGNAAKAKVFAFISLQTAEVNLLDRTALKLSKLAYVDYWRLWEKSHNCWAPNLIFTICYRLSNTDAGKWTSTFGDDLQEMQAYRCRDTVFTLSSSGQLWKMCQQHGKLCYLQWEDTRNCSNLRHVGIDLYLCLGLSLGLSLDLTLGLGQVLGLSHQHWHRTNRKSSFTPCAYVVS